MRISKRSVSAFQLFVVSLHLDMNGQAAGCVNLSIYIIRYKEPTK